MNEIMVVRFSSIGDIVLCTPVFRLLKKQFPGSKITFVTKLKFAQLLKENENIDRILCWDDEIQRKDLTNLEFDAIVDLHSNLRSSIVKLRFWQVPSVSLSKKNLSKFMYSMTKWNIFKVDSVVKRSIAILKPFGIDDDVMGLDYGVPSTIQIAAPEIKHLDDFAVVVLGGTYATKRIPENKLEELFADLQKNKVVLIGGTEEREVGERLAQKFQGGVFSMCGKLSIDESAEFMRRSKVVISGDTGMAHIAAALGKPIGLIWGNTGSGYGMFPVMKKGAEIKHFEVEDLKCWPCSKLGHANCPKGDFRCMQGQKMNEVSKFIEKYL